MWRKMKKFTVENSYAKAEGEKSDDVMKEKRQFAIHSSADVFLLFLFCK